MMSTLTKREENPFLIIRIEKNKSRKILKIIKEKSSSYKYYEWNAE